MRELLERARGRSRVRVEHVDELLPLTEEGVFVHALMFD